MLTAHIFIIILDTSPEIHGYLRDPATRETLYMSKHKIMNEEKSIKTCVTDLLSTCQTRGLPQPGHWYVMRQGSTVFEGANINDYLK